MAGCLSGLGIVPSNQKVVSSEFNSPSGHMPGWWTQFLVGVYVEDNQLMSLSLCPFPLVSL